MSFAAAAAAAAAADAAAVIRNRSPDAHSLLR